MESKSLRVQNQEWRFHAAGDGKLVLVVLAGSLGASNGTASMISNALQGARILVPEYSPVEKVSEMLDALDSILQEQEISTISLYGSSFGGLIAQAWARRNVTRISHLILSRAATPDPKRVRSHLRSLQILKFAPLWMIHSALRVSLFAMMRGSDPIKTAWKNEYKQLIARLTKEDLVSRYRIAIDLDENYHFSRNDLPVSLPLLILKNHSMMLTQTNEWVEVLTKFLGI